MSPWGSNLIKYKILKRIYITTLATLLLAVLVHFLISVSQLREHSQESLDSLTRIAAVLIEKEYMQAGENNKIRKIQEIMRLFQNQNNELNGIQVMTYKPDNTWQVAEVSGNRHNMEGMVIEVDGSGKPLIRMSVLEHFSGTFFSYAPFKDREGKAAGLVCINIKNDVMHEHQKILLLGGLGVFVLSIGFNTFTTTKGVNKILQPVGQITRAIKEIMEGNLQFRVDIKSEDEFENIGDMLNKFTEVTLEYNRILEKDLRRTKEQRSALFKVYSDVIYSVTQGKFYLVEDCEPLTFGRSGHLYGEIELTDPEMIGKARNMAEQFLKERKLEPQYIYKVLLCVSEACTNAIKHACGGVFQMGTVDGKLRIIVRDQGPGMDFDKLPHMIFLNGFSSKISMGYGFTILFKYAERLYLATSAKGTFLAFDLVLDS